jgi:threonine synthase
VYQGLIHRYREYLPVSDSTPVVTLNEGRTPLIPSRAIAKKLGLSDLYFKFDGANPTGSFKDRGMTMAVSKALEAKSEAVICASTGNTSASMAAYAGRAGMRAYMLIPHGYVAMGKLVQGMHLGANVIPVLGNFDRALELVREISEKYPVTLVNSVNPFRIEGQKTAAFEVCDDLGDAPDILAIPVGNAGNITAYWKGFREYQSHGVSKRLPKMMGFQADGAAPIVYDRPFEHPETVATAIRIGNPASWQYAVAASKDSGGQIASVTDEEILEAYCWLGREEGVFCEPASAASVAGIIKMARQGALKGQSIVCVLTGNGLKDPTTALDQVKEQTPPLEASLPAIIQAMGL